ncbi:ras GTPase-activating-like protein IQGAP2 isoform X2 [Canis lupus baileyi]|uniref:ras GTPase-activating-like protein IQGAP2 isoform X2 n=1 Tax=Canis lupus familiaris TaxID=9615 RepID=UPI0015F1AD57|nr:ras GTPase-activating-like protein IQGAP2 isoform X2 [Canis lupus familiaris]XP_038388441.1 ras GTPase-activating-like protein IQGAP2 isoform X2 [Canis lupus familiaris]XP_038516932.1 ras GTPase-activating-like protein IQGAP2 isoform X2 [Canis lupus familiaris]
MDERRRQNMAYEYLCHLEEAKRWMEVCLVEELPPTTELEEGLRNGVYLAKLAKFFAPKMVSEKKIYDVEQTRYKKSGLHFRHTDNTVQWLRAMESIGLPKIFYPETTDVYDRKNIPRMIYCIHALSLYLFKLGIAPQIQDLLGKVDFTEEEISNMRKELEKYGIQMPSFSKIGGILANELSVDEAALHAAVIAINEAIEKGIAEQTIKTLRNPNAVLTLVDDSLAQEYQKELWEAKKRKEENARLKNNCISEEERDAYEELLTQAEIQGNINKVNRLAAVDHINAAVQEGDPENTLLALKRPEAQLPAVYPFAAVMYQNELFNLQKQNAMNYLAHEELLIAVEMLSAVALLNQALESNDLVSVQNQLRSPTIGFNNLDESYVERYTNALLTIKLEALSQGQDNLSWNEIQNCIDMVNIQIQEENDRIVAVGHINEAIDEGNPLKTLDTLLLPTAKIKNVDPDYAQHYQDVLYHAKTQKLMDSESVSKVLWLDEIQHAVNEANMDKDKAKQWITLVIDVNQCLEKEKPSDILSLLKPSMPNTNDIIPECADRYYNALAKAKEHKSKSVSAEGSWLKLFLQDKYEYYYNIDSKEISWVMPESYLPKESWLMAKEIEAFWKGYKQRKAYSCRRQMFVDNTNSIVKIQSWFRMVTTRRNYLSRLQYFRDHKNEIVKIQSLLRANKARDDYKTLVGSENPPLTVIRKFVHLLDQSNLDFQEELEVARLREEVVTKIRGNQQLEKDLNLMDIKIGLLVKNRITLEDVISHRTKLNKKKGGEMQILTNTDNQGIKSLSKERRKTLETYQQLFYLLQTNPLYLAKLIFQMPQNKSTKFMDTVIFTLYNYASNQREEYLLLKLFKTALEEEIKSKVDQVQDIVTGNPTVIKMVVSFNRGARGQNTLRQLLAPVVKEILDDKSLTINTNPVEVYKAWVNQLETQTGEASKLPYDVTTEQALTYPEVKNKLEASIENLRRVTDKVLNSIISSLDLLPYGLRYIAKVLKNSIREKFPDATEDELLKIVGNLLYYRYMNPAIVAPDGFDIIDMTAGGQINPDQRRNLGSVAKVLQHAASNKLFEGENEHLSSMNNYLSETYHEFRKYFKEACNVPEPEEKFNMDKYTDVVTVSKPVIYISIEEIISTHSLLLEHQDAIAPEKQDLLNELLESLGEVPSVESFLGEGAVDPNDPNKANTLNQLAKTEISLYLTSKYDLGDGEAIDGQSLMIKTKKLIIDVIRNQPGNTLTEILETPATTQQETDHAKDMVSRAIIDSQAPEEMKHSQSMVEDAQLPLEQKKRKIQRNLRTLEQTGHVSSKNKYQDILNEIAKDIRNQRLHRKLRKAELAKLQQTLKALNEKAAFYEEQINYYDTYIKTCVDNLKRRNARRSIKLDGKGEPKGAKRSKPVRYTAAKLHEKGVLLGIDDLQTNQFKNVTFDIVSTEDVGIFDVRSKFLGVDMEKVQLNIQDLLQMQYEGVAVMKMFDKVKVNVNLLIYLLNKKFYGK